MKIIQNAPQMLGIKNEKNSISKIQYELLCKCCSKAVTFYNHALFLFNSGLVWRVIGCVTVAIT